MDKQKYDWNGMQQLASGLIGTLTITRAEIDSIFPTMNEDQFTSVQKVLRAEKYKELENIIVNRETFDKVSTINYLAFMLLGSALCNMLALGLSAIVTQVEEMREQ